MDSNLKFHLSFLTKNPTFIQTLKLSFYLTKPESLISESEVLDIEQYCLFELVYVSTQWFQIEIFNKINSVVKHFRFTSDWIERSEAYIKITQFMLYSRGPENNSDKFPISQ